MTDTETPMPTINSFYDNETSTEYAVEDTVARTRAEAAQETAEEALTAAGSANSQDIEMVNQFLRNEFEGRNILEDDKLSAEVAQETSWITWIKNRIDLRYYKGLMLRDYVNVTLSDNTVMPYQIGRFDGTFGAGNTEETSGSIDFVPVFAYPTAVQFNTTNTNQGTAAKPNPYNASNLHEWELNTYLAMLPADLRSAIVERTVLAESRYQSGQTLTDSTGWAWTNLGKIWSLSEMEVTGSVIWGTRGFTAGIDTQFPIFVSTKDRIFRSAQDGVGRKIVWLRTTCGASAASFCAIGGEGDASRVSVTQSANVAPCFRL